MGKQKKYNVFKLVTRMLRVGRMISKSLKDDQKITPDERDMIIEVMLEEVTAYLDELME
jgi:hypothetical protein